MMNRTKATLERYPRWQALNVYVERIELTINSEFSVCVGNGKSLLEAIGKEICDYQALSLGKTNSVQGVIKQALKALGLSGSHYFTQISTSLANIGENVGNLRNEIDINAHGKTLAELELQAKRTEDFTAEFLVGSIDLVAVFLIETFERFRLEKELEAAEDTAPVYLDFEDFNADFDEQHGEVFFGDYSYQPSEILFHVDRQAYDSEHAVYSARVGVGEEE